MKAVPMRTEFKYAPNEEIIVIHTWERDDGTEVAFHTGNCPVFECILRSTFRNLLKRHKSLLPPLPPQWRPKIKDEPSSIWLANPMRESTITDPLLVEATHIPIYCIYQGVPGVVHAGPCLPYTRYHRPAPKDVLRRTRENVIQRLIDLLERYQ